LFLALDAGELGDATGESVRNFCRGRVE